MVLLFLVEIVREQNVTAAVAVHEKVMDDAVVQQRVLQLAKCVAVEVQPDVDDPLWKELQECVDGKAVGQQVVKGQGQSLNRISLDSGLNLSLSSTH